jgi:hypothetical protein
MSVGLLPQQLEAKFEMNRRKVFNIVIYKELIRAVAARVEAYGVTSTLLKLNY